MPWVTASGMRLEYPYALHARIARSRHPDRDALLDALEKMQRIHEAAQQLSARVTELEAETQRLRHENAFMLRLLSERDPS